MKWKNYVLVMMLAAVTVLCAACIGKPAEQEEKEANSGNVLVLDDRAQNKDEVVQAQKNPLDGRNVFFAGYADATLNLTTTVALENLPDNEDFLMKYTVINTEDGTVVFETNLIQSGQCVAWMPGETLEPGIYNLQILQSPYFLVDGENFIPLTAGTTDVCFEITE